MAEEFIDEAKDISNLLTTLRVDEGPHSKRNGILCALAVKTPRW